MNILIDFILCILVLLVLWAASGKNTIVTIARFLALVLSVTGATLLADWAAVPLSEKLPNPIVYTAANEMAELIGTPTYESADKTLAQVDYDTLVAHPDFAELVTSYGRTEADLKQLLAEQTDDKATAIAQHLAAPLWQTILHAVLLCGITLLLYVILVAIFKAVLYRSFPKDKKRRIAVFTVLFALLSAVIVVSYVAIPVMESFRPYSMGIMKSLHWNYACEQSALYRIFSMLYIL